MRQGSAKGSVLLHFREYVKRFHGPEQLKELELALTPESRAVFSGLMIHGGWYPVSTWNEALGVFLPRHYRDPDDGMRKVAAFIANEDLNSVYKMILTLGSPEFLVKRMTSIWGRYFNTCRFYAEESGPKRWTAYLEGPRAPDQAPDYYTCGPGASAWMTHCLRLTGVNGAMEKTKCRLKTGQRCEYNVFW
jgi:hypothetical protein